MMEFRLPFLPRRGKPPGEERGYWYDFFKSDPGWWQKATDITATRNVDVASNTAVYACVNILAQEVASLSIDHWRVDQTTGERTRLFNSTPARVLRKPNPYQTRSDFWLYVMRSMLLRGGGFAVGTRNNRSEISRLDPLPPASCAPMVAPESGEIFYSIGNFGDKLIDVNSVMPAERVFNPRVNCNRHPLIGESPISAFVNAAAAGSAVQAHSARFFANMSRPSGVLWTPKTLTSKQMDELRNRWKDVTTGSEIGGTPVLHSELKWEKITMSATDSEMIEAYRLTVADVAMAYRVPLFMLGDLSKATFRNVESLMRVFYTSSLRFYLEHLENELNRLFGLDGETEYLEFDIEAGLLRGDLQSRMESFAKGVQGGVITPNEARKREQLGPQAGGDKIFLQQQMIPVELITQLAVAEIASKAPAAPPPASTAVVPVSDDDDEEEEPGEQEDAYAMANELFRRIHGDHVEERELLPVTRGAMATGQTQLTNAILRLAEGVRTAPVVHVAPPAITLNVPEQPAPIVHVNVPEQRAPVVHVAPPAVTLNVPEQLAPVVNVTVPEQRAPVVHVAPAVVNVPKADAPIVNVAPAAVQVIVPEQPAPVVHVASAVVHVPQQEAPIVNISPVIKAPTVNVSPPTVHVAAPLVNVAAPAVHVDVAAPNVTLEAVMPAAEAPVVNVSVPEQPAPVVHVKTHSKRTITKHKRDKRGELIESETLHLDDTDE
jgi:HK97 family phage portal protein